MEPITALALAGGAVTVYLITRKKGVAGQVPGQLPGVTEQLQKGKTYAVMVTITAQDGRNGQQPIGTLKVDVASANLKNVYEVLGFKVLSQPTLRNSAEVSDFLHKNPSVWLFNGQWTKDSPTIAAEPGFILSHTFVTLPVQ